MMMILKIMMMMLTKSLSCHMTASQLVREPPSPAAEKLILVARSEPFSSAESAEAAFLFLSVSCPLFSRSEGYPLYPAQVPSGNSQLARETSNPLWRPGVRAVGGGGVDSSLQVTE